jgi:phage/plasmid-associated DNA primase
MKRGKPPQELDLSEDEQKLLRASLSHAREAIDLLAACGANPDLQKFKIAQALISAASREIKYIVNHDADTLEEFNGFVEECVEFAKGARETTKAVYDAYVEWCGACENDIEEEIVFTHTRFTREILAVHHDKIFKDIQRANGGPPARCFIGLRLKEFEVEAENG